MEKSNSEAIDILISMAPEENRMEVAKLLKNHEKFYNSDDPAYQVMLQLAIYQRFQNRFPGELKEVADRIEDCTQPFLKGAEIMAKIQNQVKNTYIFFSIFLLLALSLVVMYSFSLDNKLIELEKFRMYIQKQTEYKDPMAEDIKKFQEWVKDLEKRCNN